MPFLKLLLLEDQADDEKLILREFKKADYEITYQRIQKASEFEDCLKKDTWDIIVSDYQMPSFDGIEALRILKSSKLDIPFIIVSGHIGEATAVEAMREGADDYVMKGNLRRLIPATERAIKEAQNRIKRKKAEQSLEELRMRMEGIISSAMDAIITADQEYNIVMINKAAIDLFGYRSDEIIGGHVTKLMPPRDHEKHINFLNNFGLSPKLSSMIGMNRTIYGLRADGRKFPLEASISKVTVRNKKYFTVILRDISLRLEAENQEKQLNAELIRQNEQLQQFGYIASHKMRGPIASLLGLINLFKLNDNNDAVEINQFIKYLDNTTHKLDQVIRDMNSILEHKAEINTIKEDVVFEYILRTVKKDLQTFISRSDTKIEANFIEVDKIYSIKPYIHNIFHQLISNAIKYQNIKRSPLIQIASSKVEERVCLTISDNGMGIDLNLNQNNLFGLYKRFHQHVEGKGLGLHLVKTQVDVLNGKIEVESEVDRGTTFRIYFPNA